MTLKEYDVVRLLRPLPEHKLPMGAVGAVVVVYEHPCAYEVEFCDKDGVTLALVTLSELDIEKTVSQP